MNIGDRIGDYELLGVLGAGGMGKVYKVRNLHSDRVEAMKVLLPACAGDPALVERFSREIKVHATLEHPNIARLNTAQLVDGQLIMIMEYVEGTSLDKLLASAGISLAETLAYSFEILAGLAYAHYRSVVHRDIKPANIMVTHDGKVKLMDFGIAQRQTDRRLTRTGLVVGSAPYISPEQIQGAEPDAKSDIYSFGVLLYEMATKRRPFQADSEFLLLHAHLHEAAAPPVDFAPELPRALNDAILRALAKAPETRFQSAEEFRAALAAVPAKGSLNLNPSYRGTVIARMQSPAVAEAPLPASADRSPPAQPIVVAAPNRNRWLYAAAGSSATLILIFVAITALLAKTDLGRYRLVDTSPIEAAQSRGRKEEMSPQRGAEPARKGFEASTVSQRKPESRQPTAPLSLRDQLVDIEVRAITCDALLGWISNELAADGLGLNPDVISAQTKAKSMIEQAKSDIGLGNYGEAKEHLNAAIAALQVIEKRYRR